MGFAIEFDTMTRRSEGEIQSLFVSYCYLFTNVSFLSICCFRLTFYPV
jgi:hypothetical protein